MASSGKKKTTMAKLTRESRLRERRLDKQAKKEARKQAPVHHTDWTGDPLNATTGESADSAASDQLTAATVAPLRPPAT